MFDTPSDQGKVHAVGDEAVTLLDPLGHLGELGEVEVDGPSADLADQVVMIGAITEMHDRRPMAQVNVVQVSGGLQGVDGAVDRRLVDRPSRRLLRPPVQVECGQMLVV